MSRARDIANYGDGIDTASITSGTFTDARIPNLATTKITSGQFDDARIKATNVTQHEGSIDALASNPTVTLGSNATMPSGTLVKTSATSYYNVMTVNVESTINYSVNRTTGNTTALGGHTHTTKIANPRITVFFSGQIGFQTYGTGNPTLWISMFVNDTWKTGIRTKITHNSNYEFMESTPLMMTETITASEGHSYVVKIRCALSSNFSNNTGLGSTPLVGLGHSGFDCSDGHRAHVIVQESVA